MNTLTVNLGDASYDILIDHGILSRLPGLCSERGLTGSVAIVTNPAVAEYYADRVVRSLGDAGFQTTLITVPDGEQHKNYHTLNQVYDELVSAGLDRSSFLVALGGGVVGDLAGFAAATYMRGIPYVQVPTTLLSQVDSSVGGKTAIDHPRCKNMIGAFHQPRLVLIDLDTLQTLPRREYRAGLAEVIKYGIAMDPVFFEYLENHCDGNTGDGRLLPCSRYSSLLCAESRDCGAGRERVGPAGQYSTMAIRWGMRWKYYPVMVHWFTVKRSP